MSTQNTIAGLAILYPNVEFIIQNGILSWTDGPSVSVIQTILDSASVGLEYDRKYSVRFINRIATQEAPSFKIKKFRVVYQHPYGPSVECKKLTFVSHVWGIAREMSAEV